MYRDLLLKDRESITLFGRVVNMPQRQVMDATGRTNWVFLCEVEGVQRYASDVPASGHVRVIMPVENAGMVTYGDRWRLSGSYRRDERPLFQSRGIAGMLAAEPMRSRRLETNAGNRWVAWCYAMRARSYEQLGWGVGDESSSASMSRALLLGYRQDVAKPVYDAFACTGTLHILSLSGMHVGILVLLLVIVLKALGISRQYWVLYFIPVLAVYTVGTGAASSMVRSSLMAITYFAAFLLRRKPDAASSLALAALIILLVDPMELFSLGFILSFVAVGGLVVLYPRLTAWAKRASGPDPWAEPEQGWMNVSSPLRNMLVGSLCISLAAWLATLPLIATIYHLVSPVALVVNLAMGPLTFVILLTACLSLVSAVVWDQAAIIFNYANDVFAELLLSLVTITSSWPGGYFYVPAWPIIFILGWYVLLILCIAGRSWLRWMSISALLAMVVFSIGQRSWSREVEAIIIPNGDAHVLLIDGPGNHAVLVDAGSKYHHRRLLDDLRARGINRLDEVWITRATSDAYSGLAGIIESMTVNKIVVPFVQKRQPAFLRDQLQWATALGNDRVHYWSDVRSHEGAGGVVYHILHPAPGGEYSDSRRSSLVLRIARGHESLLFAGRIDHLQEAEMLAYPIDWQADRLVVGSCVDPLVFATPWLSLIDPETVVINLKGFDHKPEGPGALLGRLKIFPDLRVEDDIDKQFSWSL